MRYVVHGAGAIGGVIGAELTLSGRDVTLIARGEHLAAIQADGLRVDRASGEVTVPAHAVGSPADVRWTDDTVVLLCVKSHQGEAALADLAAHAPVTTPIVACQNGIANERRILRRFANTYGMCVMMPAAHLAPGLVEEHSAGVPGLLDVGRYPVGVDGVVETVVAELTAAGFSSFARPDVMAWKTRKLMNNLGNGIEALVGTGPVADDLHARAVAEGRAAVAAAGLAMVTDQQDRERRAGLMPIRTDVDRASSTKQSILRGLDTEIDYLSGEVVLLGRLFGVPTPVNEAVQHAVHALVRTGEVDATALLACLEPA